MLSMPSEFWSPSLEMPTIVVVLRGRPAGDLQLVADVVAVAVGRRLVEGDLADGVRRWPATYV